MITINARNIKLQALSNKFGAQPSRRTGRKDWMVAGSNKALEHSIDFKYGRLETIIVHAI